MKSPNKYSYAADALRIIAIIGVITIHVSQSFVDYPPYFHGASWWFANLLDSFSRVSVPLFIMLSGVLILDVEKTHTPLEYFTKRIKRVGIPLVVWSIFYLLWRYFYWHQTFTPSEILKDFLAPNIYYHLYFLYVILGLYIVAPFLKIIVMHISKISAKYTLVAAFTFVSLLFALNKLLPDVSIAFNGFTLFMPYIPYFIAGHYLWQVRIDKKQFWIFASGFIIFFLFTAVGNLLNMLWIGWSKNNMVYDRYFYEYFSPNIVSMSVLAFIMIKNVSLLFPKSKTAFVQTTIKFLAPLVFGIYLIHVMILDVIGRYIPAFNIVNMEEHIAPFLLVTKLILVLGVSFLIVGIGKRIKYLQVIFG